MASKFPPFNPDALFQHATSLHQMERLDEAAAAYAKLLELFPKQPEVLNALGTLRLQQGRAQDGVKLLKQSLSIAPSQPMGHYNLGIELQRQGKLGEALLCYDRAIALNPRDADTHLNRGNVLKDLKRNKEALASYDRAIALQPDLASAYWNKALLKILAGDYEEGWRLYEWGWKSGERGSTRQFFQPLWLGEQQVAGKTLLIRAEQGLGDFIQFCRYVPMVEALGARVVLEVPASLVSLLATLPGHFTVVEKGQPLPEFDLHCPVMSLPLALKTTVASIPADIPYFYVDAHKQEMWRQRLGARTKPRIGLVWSGSTTQIDLNPCSKRSLPLEALQPLLRLPLEFHALQKEIRPEDAAMLARWPQLRVHQDELHDFSDTAALIGEMDLVISVCTSVAHLAGALCRPLWVMLPYSPDYRWMLERTDSPWYPTATLFRQTAIGDWSGVAGKIAKQLLDLPFPP